MFGMKLFKLRCLISRLILQHSNPNPHGLPSFSLLIIQMFGASPVDEDLFFLRPPVSHVCVVFEPGIITCTKMCQTLFLGHQTIIFLGRLLQYSVWLCCSVLFRQVMLLSFVSTVSPFSALNSPAVGAEGRPKGRQRLNVCIGRAATRQGRADVMRVGFKTGFSKSASRKFGFLGFPLGLFDNMYWFNPLNQRLRMVLQKFLVQDVVLAAVACDGLVLSFLDGLLGGIAWIATGTKLPIHCDAHWFLYLPLL